MALADIDMKAEPLRAPRGGLVLLMVRAGTSDMAHAHQTFYPPDGELHDEYDLASFELGEGKVMVDVGAYIGTITFAFLADNPGSRVIAVEPVPENCELIRMTAALNGWSNRLELIEAAVGSGEVHYGYAGTSYASDNRFVGNLGSEMIYDHTVLEVPVVSLEDIVIRAGGHIDLLKIDCEGGEWRFLDSPFVGACDVIVGEGHGEPWIDGKIHDLLGKTHDIEIRSNPGGTGIFRANLKVAVHA